MPVNAENTSPETTEGATEASSDAAGTDVLGDAGKRALEAERASRREAEKRVKALEAQIKAAADKERTEAEKRDAEYTALRAEVERMKAEKTRAEASASSGVPVSLLSGPGEDVEAYAKAIREWAGGIVAEAGKPTGAEQSSGGFVRHMGSPAGSGTRSLSEQIADAEKAGDYRLVGSLKALQLGNK